MHFFLIAHKVCNKYSVVIFLLLQYASTDQEETSLRPIKKHVILRVTRGAWTSCEGRGVARGMHTTYDAALITTVSPPKKKGAGEKKNL